jgi:uncharacterized membrane protein YeaQ/YmgE (transglycosylase-associated protein family)
VKGVVIQVDFGQLIWFLIIGVVAGWLAGQIFRGGGFGLWGDLAVGVVGALVGGYVFGLLGITAYGMIGSIVTSVVGALLFLWVLRLFSKPRATASK